MGGDPADRVIEAFRPGQRSLASMAHAGEPVTAVAVEREILRLSARLEAATDEFSGRARMAAESEAVHKGKWAACFLTSEAKTEAQRKAEADIAVHDEYMRRRIDESLKESCKEAMSSLRAQLDALRTLSANIRAQT